MAAPPQELERSIKGRGQPPAREKPPAAPAPAQSEPESDQESFACVQFSASYPYLCGVLMVLMSFCALFIFEQPIFEEPRSSAESGPPRPLARASVALGAVAIPLRSWLHHWLWWWHGC